MPTKKQHKPSQGVSATQVRIGEEVAFLAARYGITHKAAKTFVIDHTNIGKESVNAFKAEVKDAINKALANGVKIGAIEDAWYETYQPIADNVWEEDEEDDF